jgi:hypothetical protein
MTGRRIVMGNKKEFRSKYAVWLVMGIFFLVFLLMSFWSPIAGDDWAYAVNSMDHHPLALVLERYFYWSGRLLSELWGYIIPKNKWLWDWLNPCIFTAILWYLLKNAGARKHPAVSALAAFALIFTVTDYLRMQTYTWMMGTTYVVPLLLFLVYLWLLQEWIFHDSLSRKAWAALCILNFTIPLWMENAAAMILGGDFLILIYLWAKDRSRLKKMLVLTALAAAGTLIIRLSPGAASRLVNDHPEFVAMSLWEKIKSNWNTLIRLTYADNVWLTRTMSVLFILLVLLRRKQYPFARWHCWLIALFFVFGIVQTYAYNLWQWNGDINLYNLADPTWWGFRRQNTIGYGLWTLAALYVILTYLKGNKKWFTAFVYLCALGANAVMLLSPIFDARSSIYTVYLFILVCLLLLEEFDLPKAAPAVLAAGLSAVCAFRISSYLQLYYQVSRITWAREQYIAWYLGKQDKTTGDMPAYPELSIASGNIAEGDDYHTYYFLRYYDLNPNLKLTFKDIDLNTVGKGYEQ